MTKLDEFLEIAERELGTKEIKGGEHNPRVVEYHQATSLGASDDETPWCSSFVAWVVEQAGVVGTNSAAARSWLDWGVPVDTPEPGCIVVLKRGNSSWQGHVGFYAGETESAVEILGGNQSDEVNLTLYPKTRVLGYRVPKRARNSKTVAASIAAGLNEVTAPMIAEAVTSAKTVTDTASGWTQFAESFGTAWPYISTALTVGLIVFIIRERVRKIRERQV